MQNEGEGQIVVWMLISDLFVGVIKKPTGRPSKPNMPDEVLSGRWSGRVPAPCERSTIPAALFLSRPHLSFPPSIFNLSISGALPSPESKQHNFIIVAVNTVIIEAGGGDRLPYYTFNKNIADAH